MNKSASGSTARGLRNLGGQVSTVLGRENLSAEAAALLTIDHGPIGATKHGATQGLIGSVAAAAAHNTTDKQALFDQSVATLRKSIFEASQEGNTLESARKGFLDGFASGAAATKLRTTAKPVVSSPEGRPAENAQQKARRKLQERLDAAGLNDDQVSSDRELG